MKSGHKTIIFLATAAVGLFSCGQIITSKSDESEANDARPWKFVSAESSSSGTFALTAYESDAEPEFAGGKAPNAFETIPISDVSHAPDQAPFAIDNSLEQELTLQDAVALESAASPQVRSLPGLDMENGSTGETGAASDSHTSSLPSVSSLPSIDDSIGSSDVVALNEGSPEIETPDNTAAPGLNRVANRFVAEQDELASPEFDLSNELATTDQASDSPMVQSIENQFVNQESGQNDEFRQDTQPQAPSSNQFELEPETEVAAQVDEMPLPNLDSDSGFRAPETFAAAGSSEWSGEFKPEIKQTPASSAGTFRADPPAIKKPTKRKPERTAMRRRLPSLKASPVVEQRAREHIVYGKSLARRNAVFAARQEFVQALSLIADSHDMNSGSRDYTARLASGLRALGESDDFVAVDSEQQLNMDLRSILETHSTRLIDPANAETLSPIQAMQIYYGFVGEEIAMAIGQSEVASDALHSLGKLLTTVGRFDASGKPTDRAKAMVMHQVALAANPRNYQSANELGVLMARNGRWQQAHDLLTDSLRVRKTAETWKNLAKVHEQLATTSDIPQVRDQQSHLAKLAFSEYERMVQGNALAGSAGSMEWVTPAQFNQRGAMPELQNDVGARTAQAVAPAEPKPKAKGLLRKLF